MKARAEVTDVPSPQRAVQIAWALAITILTGYGAAVSIGRTTHGFIAYYAAARLFVAGDLSTDAYDDRWFGGYVQRITGTGVREIFTPNPPAMALMAVPLAGLQPQPARSIWLLASILAYAAAIALLLRHAPLTSTRWLPVAVFLLSRESAGPGKSQAGAGIPLHRGRIRLDGQHGHPQSPAARRRVSGVLCTQDDGWSVVPAARHDTSLESANHRGRRDRRCDGSHRGPRRSGPCGPLIRTRCPKCSIDRRSP